MITIKHIKSALLTINGDKRKVEWLGQGMFAEAWKNCQSVYLIMKDRPEGQDHSKQVLAHCREMKHLPKTEYIGEIGERAVYQMDLYEPLTAKSGVAWLNYKVLAKLCDQTWSKVSYGQRRSVDQNAQEFHSLFQDAVDDASLPDSLKEAIEHLYTQAWSFMAAPKMEIAKRNCSIDAEGNLVLRDVLFDMEMVDQIRKRESKRHERRW